MTDQVRPRLFRGKDLQTNPLERLARRAMFRYLFQLLQMDTMTLPFRNSTPANGD